MERVKFYVHRISADMCRIVPNDCRSIFHQIAGGACIMDLEVMLDEMEHISAECEKIGFYAVFETM